VLKQLDRAYFALFRECPLLLRLAVVTGAGQLAFALLNIYALPVYLVQDLHLSGKALGAATSTFLLCEMLLKFPMGRLSDRFGRKPFIVLGPLLICLNPILIVRLPVRLWALVFPVRAVDGVGAAALWPPLFAMAGDVARSRSRAAAMSVLNTVYVGAIAGAAIVGSFAAHLAGSDRFPFYLASGLLFLSALTGYWGLPRVPVCPPEPGQDETPVAPPTAADMAEPSDTPYPIAVVLTISLLMTLGVLTLAQFLILYVGQELDLSRLSVGVLLAALGVPVLLLGLPLGHAADRWGKSRTVRVSLAASAVAMWAIPFCHTVATFSAVGVFLVLSQVAAMPAWLALVSELAPANRRGGVMGLVATAEGAGATLGPLLGGALWDLGPRNIFFGSAVLLTLAAIVAALTLRAKGR
jgi:MFS family permease